MKATELFRGGRVTARRVRQFVKHIASVAADDESAHSAEDFLYSTILRAIASGECDDPRACATEALKTEELQFHRWCA